MLRLVIHSIRLRPRLLASTVAGGTLFLLFPHTWPLMARLLAAWDSALLLYLALAAHMMAQADNEEIRCRAAQQDEGKGLMLALTIVTSIASLAAIIAELASAKGLKGHDASIHVALAALTVILSWMFLQTMFALHYAHEYYAEHEGKALEGLEFPGHELPDYWDFVYFSFIIGTAAQTADVNIASRAMRKLATIHCIVAFFFNTTILALTVNIGAGLF